MKAQYKVSAHYDLAPQLYPEIQGDTLSSLECRTFQKFISLYTDNIPVIDLGCGTGRVGRYLSQVLKPEILVFMELSKQELNLAKNLGSKADFAFYIRGDVFHLPFKQIHYCTCHGVVHHTPDPHHALAEIVSTLASGGILYLAIYAKSWYWYLYRFFSILRKSRQLGYHWIVNLAFYLFALPRYFLRLKESKTLHKDFNLRASFEDFVMTPYAYFFSDRELRIKFKVSNLEVIDHERLNYGVLHCYVLRKSTNELYEQREN